MKKLRDFIAQVLFRGDSNQTLNVVDVRPHHHPTRVCATVLPEYASTDIPSSYPTRVCAASFQNTVSMSPSIKFSAAPSIAGVARIAVPSSADRLVHRAAAVEFSRPLPPAADTSVWFVLAVAVAAAAAPGSAEPPAACDVPGWSSSESRSESGKASANEVIEEVTRCEKTSTSCAAVDVCARSAVLAAVRWSCVPEVLPPRWCAVEARSNNEAGGSEEERKGSA